MPPTPPRLALTKLSLGLRSSLVTSEACGGTQSLLVCKGVTMFAPLQHLPFCPLGAESGTCPQVSALRIRLLCLLCSRSAVQVPVPLLCSMDKLTPALWTTTRWQLPPYHTITTCPPVSSSSVRRSTNFGAKPRSATLSHFSYNFTHAPINSRSS